MENELLITVSVAFALLVLFLYRPFSSTALPFPPGPKPKFWSGNAHQLPKSEPWVTFTKWSEIYGPIVFFRTSGTKTIVLNSAKAALDLLESRSSIYSDRPVTWMFGELVGRKLTVFWTPFHHPRFRKYRKMLHSGLNPRATQVYRPIQEQETRTFLRALADSPEDFMLHIGRTTGAVILKATYGSTDSTQNDKFLAIFKEGFSKSAVMQAERWLVEVIPILRFLPEWFPGARFKRVARELRETMSQIEEVPYAWAKEKIESGNYVESFISRYIRPEDRHALDEEEEDCLKWCSEALYVGGADTTVSAMTSFFFLMSIHPDIQKHAQTEVDKVMADSGHLPTVDDYKKMPYISALIREVVRWIPVAPLGLRHRVTEEDVYQGYRIPKGATIIPNIWAITHDSDLYPEPSIFNPERHLGPKPQTDPFKFVFGFGRRVCPGAHFAELSLFLNISNILATFNINKALDKDGQEIQPAVVFSTGATTHLKNFGCRITPRSQEALAMLSGY